MSEINEFTKGRFRGIATVEDLQFNEVNFDSFSINPSENSKVTFRNCIFRKCKVTKAAFQLGRNVVLDNVSFENMLIDGHFHIDSAVEILSTKIISSNPKDVLWIKNILEVGAYVNNPIELDISGFSGEVLITGVDVSRIKVDSSKQVFISKDLLNQTDFKINRANFFRSSASKVENSGSTVGVFSLPANMVDRPEFSDQFKLFKQKSYVY